MLKKIIIAGFGGQGVISLGKLIGETAAYEGKYATYLPAYGPEMRGGTAHCMVCVSDEEIASPFVEAPDISLLFTEPAFEKFYQKTDSQGIVIVNSSLVAEKVVKAAKNGAKIEYEPLTDVAQKIGSVKIANVVGLSLLLKKEKLLDPASVEAVIREKFPPESANVSLNLKALYYFLKSRE